MIGWEYVARREDDKARAAFEKALDFDSGYAEAKFGLALLELGPFGSSDEGSQAERASLVLEEALALARHELMANERNAKTHFVMARISRALAGVESEILWRQAGNMDADGLEARKLEIKKRFAQSEQHFRTAITLNPSLTPAYVWLADMIEQQGVERAGEALQVLEGAQERDPLNIRVNTRIAKRWAGRGRFRQAIELLDRFKALPETPREIWWWQLELMTLQHYWADKGQTLIEMLLSDPDAFAGPASLNRWQAWWFASQLAYLGLNEEAEAWYRRLEHLPLNEYLYQLGEYAYLDAMGHSEEVIETETQNLANMSDEQILDAYSGSASSAAYMLAEKGEHERAIRLMESVQHAPAIWSEREPNYIMQLASLYLQSGREEDAAPLLHGIQIHLETAYADGIRHPHTLSQLAEVYLLQERNGDALDMLRKSVDYHLLASCEDDIFRGPPWDRMHDNPSFIELCERIQADLDQQASRVRKMLAHHDLDDLLAPLMVMVEDGPGK